MSSGPTLLQWPGRSIDRSGCSKPFPCWLLPWWHLAAFQAKMSVWGMPGGWGRSYTCAWAQKQISIPHNHRGTARLLVQGFHLCTRVWPIPLKNLESFPDCNYLYISIMIITVPNWDLRAQNWQVMTTKFIMSADVLPLLYETTLSDCWRNPAARDVICRYVLSLRWAEAAEKGCGTIWIWALLWVSVLGKGWARGMQRALPASRQQRGAVGSVKQGNMKSSHGAK